MIWRYDPDIDASYIFIAIKPAILVTADLSGATVMVDVDKDTGDVMGIEILADGTGTIARALEHYLGPPERLGEHEPPEPR